MMSVLQKCFWTFVVSCIVSEQNRSGVQDLSGIWYILMIFLVKSVTHTGSKKQKESHTGFEPMTFRV
jgi:hypothetical protein